MPKRPTGKPSKKVVDRLLKSRNIQKKKSTKRGAKRTQDV